MATKNVNQPTLQAAIDHFNIDCDPYGIMVSGSNGNIEKVHADESAHTWRKLKAILSDDDETKAPDLTKLKKAFVFPGCDVSQDRIKSALKEHKVTVTNDYELADVYITHFMINGNFENGDTVISTTLFPKLWNYDSVEEGSTIITNYTDDTNNMKGGERARIIVDDKLDQWFNRRLFTTFSMPVESWLLTGMAVNCAYNVEMGNAEVWHVEKVLNQSANKVDLTEQLISDITALQNSRNNDDHNMIGSILPTIKYKEKYHLLWALSQELDNLYNFNRNKDVQFWISVSEIQEIRRRSALEMIQYLEEQELLNNESFQYLEGIVRKEIRIENRDLYTFKVELKPEYKLYKKMKI